MAALHDAIKVLQVEIDKKLDAQYKLFDAKHKREEAEAYEAEQRALKEAAMESVRR